MKPQPKPKAKRPRPTTADTLEAQCWPAFPPLAWGMTYVYFAQCTVTARIKIGESVQPRDRMFTLQIGSPTALRLVGVLAGPMWLEGALHHRFSAQRLHGEWFALAPPLTPFVLAVRSGEVQHRLNIAEHSVLPDPMAYILDGQGVPDIETAQAWATYTARYHALWKRIDTLMPHEALELYAMRNRGLGNKWLSTAKAQALMSGP